MASLLSFAKKAIDQINPLDNGKTYQNSQGNHNPGPVPSAFHQLTHNGATNLAGNFAVKPFVLNPLQIASEIPRAITAEATHNLSALRASQGRELQNLKSSIPGIVANQGINIGQAGYNLGFKAPILDLKGNSRAAEQARTTGLREFNNTAPGQLTRPAQYGIANLSHASKQAQANVGLDTRASGAQKYFADPLLGAAGTLGLIKTPAGIAKLAKSGKAAVEDAKAGQRLARVPDPTTTKIPVQVKPGPRTSQVPVAVHKRIPVRQVPSHQELADRYNTHMANLSKEFGRNQVPLTTAGKPGRQGIIAEPSVYNDVAYQAKKQQIEQAYKDGTLSKPIKVSDAPKTSPKLPTPPKTNAPATPAVKVATAQTRTAPKTKPVPEGQIPLNLPKTSDTLTAAKSPGAFKRSWQSTRGVISQFGTAGKEIARRLQEHRFQSEIGQEKFLESIPSVGKLNPGDFKTFVRVLDARSKGQDVSAASHIEKAVGEWNKAIPTIRDRAVKAGINVGDLGENYFPRVYKDLFTRNSQMTKMADNMVKSGKAKSFEDAIGQLRFMQKDYVRTHGNLEHSRTLDMPGYEMTHDAATGYVARAFDRITKAEQFGPNGELINQAQAHMLKEGHDAGPGSVVDKYTKIALGDENKNTAGYKVSSAVRKFNALRSLNTAAISNASQLTNTATVGGIGRTLKSIGQRLDPVSEGSKNARDQAKQAGVELDHTINNLSASQLGVKGKFLKNVASPFFHTVEKFNRTVTAMVGKDYGNHLAAKAAKGDRSAARKLNDLGINPQEVLGGRLTRDQELRAASKLVERSQFKVDAQDLPGWADSAMGKLASQFRTFGYKQTSFMYNEVLREAVVNKNYAPLARFISVGIPVGSAQLALKGAIKAQPMTGSNPTDQSIKALAAVGGGGLPGSEGQNLANGIKYSDPVGAVLSTVGGPTLSFIGETGKNITTAMKGKGTDPLKKEGVRSIPVVGPAAAGRLFPKKPFIQGNAISTDPNLNPSSDQAKADAAVQKKAFENNKSNDGLLALPNGTYAYKLGNGETKTADTLKKARDEIAKDALVRSGDSYKVVGDTVYRIGEDGKPTQETKTKFDYQLGTATLTQQKNNDDVQGYIRTANQQIDRINKQLFDSSTDPVERLKLQNDATALRKNIAKYTEYGGFTKAGSSSSKAKARAASFKTNFKTTSIKTPKIRGVKVSKVASSKPLKTRKISVSKMPKIT